MCNFVTFAIIKAANLQMRYTEDEQEQLEQNVEHLQEAYFVDKLFDFQSRLEYKIFVEKTEKDCAWMLNAQEFREQYFDLAQLKNKY